MRKIAVLIAALVLVSGHPLPSPAAARSIRFGESLTTLALDVLGGRSPGLARAIPASAVVGAATLTPAVATAPPTRSTPAPDAPGGLTADILGNVTYQSRWTQSGAAPLKNGVYSEPDGPGSATRTEVKMTSDVAYGVLGEEPGAGEPGAAVILMTTPGGDGIFYQLAVVVERHGMPQNIGVAELGARVHVNSVSVANNRIFVDLIRAGQDDPVCCPTVHVLQVYSMKRDGELVLTSSLLLGTVSATGTPIP